METDGARTAGTGAGVSGTVASEALHFALGILIVGRLSCFYGPLRDGREVKRLAAPAIAQRTVRLFLSAAGSCPKMEQRPEVFKGNTHIKRILTAPLPRIIRAISQSKEIIGVASPCMR